MDPEDPFGFDPIAKEMMSVILNAVVIGGSVIFAAGALVGAVAVLVLR